MGKLELIQSKMALNKQAMSLITLGESEMRKLTVTENSMLTEIRKQIADIDEKIKTIDAELENEKRVLDNQKKTNQKNTNNMNKNYSIVKEIRNAIDNGTNKFTISEERDATLGGFKTGEGAEAVQHDTTVVETEVKPILEPLYANSVISSLGATIYHGMPMGEISVPVMSKNGAVDWTSENGDASEGQNEFSNVTLRPKRLVAQVNISKMLLATDTVGVEQAIRRDIVKALQNKFESTILGDGAKTDTKPAGIFNGKTFKTIASFADICDLESNLEDKGVATSIKYVLSPKVKSNFRQLAKGTKSTQLVYENGEVDGTPSITTSLVPAKTFAYGAWDDFLVGIWGNTEVVVDPYTLAHKGLVRLIVTMFADAQLAREDAIVFGNIA